MNAYFSINPTVYKNNKIKIALIFSKMGTEKEVTFSKTWYNKMANTTIKPEETTLVKFMDDYNKNFCPFNIKERAHRDISRLYQKPGKDKDGTPNNGFQDYISEFQNLVTKAKFKDKLTACTLFSAGLDQQISTMILSMATLPDTLEEWLDKAKVFHGHKLRINDFRGGIGNHPYIFHFHQTSSPCTSYDPNTMEVNFVELKKLTPQEWAKCMREGHCFKYRKIGHNARNCRSSGQPQPNSNNIQMSQQIRHTKDVPVTSTPVKKATTYVFSTYAQTLGKSEDELLQTLKMCYEEPDEEVRITTTFESNEEGF